MVDGLFGIGLNRPLEGAWIALVQCLNESGVAIASVDVPSGLNADTGVPMGVAIKDGKDADGKPVTTWEIA